MSKTTSSWIPVLFALLTLTLFAATAFGAPQEDATTDAETAAVQTDGQGAVNGDARALDTNELATFSQESDSLLSQTDAGDQQVGELVLTNNTLLTILLVLLIVLVIAMLF